MVRKSLLIVGVAAALSMCLQAEADQFSFSFSGAGFSGSGVLTYGPDTQGPITYSAGTQTDPVGAYAITKITGTFSDATDNIVNAAITGLVPIAPAAEHDNPFDPLVPASLSFVDYTGGDFSYDNLFFPGGNPLDCTVAPGSPISQTGTYLDVFGMAFTVDGGYTADIWGDGSFLGGPNTYGVEVTNSSQELGNTFFGVNLVPEPGSASMLGAGLLLLLAFTTGAGTFGRRRRRAAS